MARYFVPLLLIALALRLLAFPLTGVTNEGDSVPRIYVAWQWLEHPTFLSCTGWPPFHFYLIGASLWLWFDPLRSPSVLHMLISVATAIPLWGFTRRQWGEKGALFVAAAFLFYPLAWRLSFTPASEGVFAFFVASGMYFLFRARDSASFIHAACAGVSMTLAGAVRLEGWALIPISAVVLWGRWKVLLTYLTCAAVFPVFCMASNIRHGLEPISYLTTLKHWDLDVEGLNEGLNAWKIAWRIAYYPAVLIFSLTPPVAALCAIGFRFVWQDRTKRIWLFPFVMLLFIFMEQAARGIGGTKARYLLILGVMFLPFSGAAIEKFAGKAWLKTVAVLSIALMLPLSYSRVVLYKVAGPDFPNPFPADIHAIPRIKEEIKEIGWIAQQNLTGRKDGLLVDFFGKDFYPWKDTYVAALRSRAHPTQVFFMPGGRYEHLNVPKLQEFLLAHPSGILLYERSSRWIRLQQSRGSASAQIDGFQLEIHPLKSVKSIIICRYQVR